MGQNGLARVAKWALAASASVLLAGCGFGVASSSVGGTPPSTPPSLAGTVGSSSLASSSSSAVLSSPTSSTTPVTNPADLPVCTAANLKAGLVSTAQGVGSQIRVYAFTNESSAPCALRGYPGFYLLDAQDHAMPTYVSHITMAENLVVLHPQGQAWFVIQYPDAKDFPGKSCPASSAIEVVPPGNNSGEVLKGRAGTLTAFGGTSADPQCGHVSVQPVTQKGVPLSP